MSNSGASTPVPADHPLMIAWTAYKASEDYADTKRWAVNPLHVEGSLWGAFMTGFQAAATLAKAESQP